MTLRKSAWRLVSVLLILVHIHLLKIKNELVKWSKPKILIQRVGNN